MIAKVYLLRRFGVRLGDRDAAGAEPLLGELQLSETQYNGCAVRMLTLAKLGSNVDNMLATLAEPVILGLGNNRTRFRGIEAVKTRDGKAGMVQEWIVEVVNR
jgi:hypothetical protein